MTQTQPNQLTIGDVSIVDAWVDFDINQGASNQRLAIETDGQINTLDVITPIGTHPEIESHNPDDTYWIGYGDGIYRRFKDGKVGVPANTSPKTNTVEVESVDTTEDRVPGLTHTTRREINEQRPHTAIQALFKGKHLSEQVIDISLANEIVKRYINGPLGSDNTSKTYHERSTPGRPHWKNLQTAYGKDTYEQLNDLTINFVLTDHDDWGLYPNEETDLLIGKTLIAEQYNEDEHAGLWTPNQ